jgi:hypothetical protein
MGIYIDKTMSTMQENQSPQNQSPQNQSPQNQFQFHLHPNDMPNGMQMNAMLKALMGRFTQLSSREWSAHAHCVEEVEKNLANLAKANLAKAYTKA